MTIRSVAVLALLAIASGCGSPISTMASHTVATGPDAEQDVVWVVARGKLQRCTAIQNKPVCTPVPTGN